MPDYCISQQHYHNTVIGHLVNIKISRQVNIITSYTIIYISLYHIHILHIPHIQYNNYYDPLAIYKALEIFYHSWNKAHLEKRSIL